MTEMKCKIKNSESVECGIPIDYDKETKTATEIQSGNKHICPNLKAKPYPKTWSKKAFNDTTNLQYDAVLKELEVVKQDLESVKEALRAIVAEQSFRTASGNKLDNSE